MNRALLVLVLAAACAAGAFLLLESGGEGPHEPGTPVTSETERAAPRAAGVDPVSARDPTADDPARRVVESAGQEAGPADRTPASAADSDPGPPLRIRVVDAQGAPRAGIPVGVAILRTRGWRSLGGGTTGAGGVAVVDRRATWDALEPDQRAVAFVDAPLGTTVRADVDLAAPPDEPVELVLPPSGSVVIAAETVAPSRADGARAVVSVTGAGDEGPVGSARADLRDGIARFPCVGLGLELRCALSRDGWNTDRATVVRGPVAEGQELVVRIPLATDAPLLVARLVGPDGEPVASTRLDVAAEASDGSTQTSSRLDMRTDADGVVFFELGDGLAAGAERSLWFRAGERGLEVRTELPCPLPSGETDLGTLRMTEPPVLLTGSVVDELGAPIDGARVALAARVVFDAAKPDAFYEDDLDGAQTRTNADGAFTIQGTSEHATLLAKVEADGYLAQRSDPTPRGTRGLRVVLARAGGLSGSIVAPELDGLTMFVVTVTHRASGAVTTEHRGGGTFALTSLAPGLVDVGVRLEGSDTLVEPRRGVSIVGGETTALAPFDLTGAIRVATVRVVDTLGTPIRNASVLWMAGDAAPGGRTEIAGVGTRDGTGRLVVPTGAVTLHAFAPGHRAVRVPLLHDEQDVTLPAAPTVVLRVPTDALPSAPTFVHVRLRQTDSAFGRSASYRFRMPDGGSRGIGGMLPWEQDLAARIGPDGRAVLRPSEPGTYTSTWRLERDDETGHKTTGLSDVAPQEIVVADTAAEQTVEVTVTRETLEAAAERLR